MRTVENVPVPAATCDRSDLAAVKADGHLVGYFRFGGRGWFCYRAAQVEPCEMKKERKRSEL